jgi:predicted dehydrogenase
MAETYSLKVEPDARSLVRRDDVDAVLITTPHHIHVAEALGAIQCGKHLLIEKPITTSVEDCDRILEAADRKGVVLLPWATTSAFGECFGGVQSP